MILATIFMRCMKMWNNNITELVAELKVPWDDLKVLSTPSKELNLVSYYLIAYAVKIKRLKLYFGNV